MNFLLSWFGAKGENVVPFVTKRTDDQSSRLLPSNAEIAQQFVNEIFDWKLVHKGMQIIIERSSYRLPEFKKNCTKPKKV